MKAQMVSTEKTVMLEKESGMNHGIRARIWEGVTDSGIPFHAFIVRIGVAPEHDSEAFDRELDQCVPPSLAIQAIPLRLAI